MICTTCIQKSRDCSTLLHSIKPPFNLSRPFSDSASWPQPFFPVTCFTLRLIWPLPSKHFSHGGTCLQPKGVDLVVPGPRRGVSDALARKSQVVCACGGPLILLRSGSRLALDLLSPRAVGSSTRRWRSPFALFVIYCWSWSKDWDTVLGRGVLRALWEGWPGELR